MQLRLRDDLSFCLCAETVVFLDLRADRYFCLADDLEPAFKRWFAGGGRTKDDPGLRTLQERGLLVLDSRSATAPNLPLVPRATHDLIEATAAATSGADVVRALVAEVAVATSLRCRPLIDVVRRCRARSRRARATSEVLPKRVECIAAAFARSALLMGSADRCLVRALALMLACHRLGIYPTLVFGVRINPFAAHCWAQIGDSVLVGDFEQVRLFTPILAVG